MPKKILIIEDNKAVLNIYQHKLIDLDCEINPASNGREAIHIVETNPPDLMILDLMLPDYSGEELLEILSKKGIKIPFIIITAITDPKTAVSMMKLGAIDYVIKENDLFDKIYPIVENAINIISAKNDNYNDMSYLLQAPGDFIKIEASNFNASFSQFIIDSIDAIVLALDTKGKILFVNNYFELISGYQLEEIIGTKWFDKFIPDNKKSHISKIFSNAIANKSTMDINNPICTKSGKILNIKWHDKLIINNKGNVVGMLAIGHDITKTIEVEKALEESEAKYKELFENMSNGVAVYEGIENGEDFIFKNMNIAAQKIEKIDRDAVINKKLSDIVPKEYNKGLFDAFKRVYKTSVPEHYQFTFFKNLSIEGWRDNFIYKLPSGEIVSIFDDATDRKSKEEALRESEERYRSFVQNFKGIAYRRSPDFTPIFFHGSVADISGYSENEFISGAVKWEDIIHPEDAFIIKSYSNHIGKTYGFEYDCEYRIIRKDGQIIWVSDYLQNIGDRTGKIIYIQGSIYSVTERKKAEFELKKSQEQLRNLAAHLETAREEEKKRIALEIHDELGHALTALKLDLAWILKKRFLRHEVLIKKIQEMTELIESTIRKVRSISTELRPSVLDHFGLLAAIEWQTKEFQKRTAIRCKLNMNLRELTLDEYRSTSIFRIFQEVLTNVARHADATRIDISLEKVGRDLELKVSDNGKGIKIEQIADLKSFGIIGIYERANSMSGEVNFNGVIGVGTTVILRVPLN